MKGVRIVRDSNHLVLNVLAYYKGIGQKSVTCVFVVELAFCCWVVKWNILVKVFSFTLIKIQYVIIGQGFVLQKYCWFISSWVIKWTHITYPTVSFCKYWFNIDCLNRKYILVISELLLIYNVQILNIWTESYKSIFQVNQRSWILSATICIFVKIDLLYFFLVRWYHFNHRTVPFVFCHVCPCFTVKGN